MFITRRIVPKAPAIDDKRIAEEKPNTALVVKAATMLTLYRCKILRSSYVYIVGSDYLLPDNIWIKIQVKMLG